MSAYKALHFTYLGEKITLKARLSSKTTYDARGAVRCQLKPTNVLKEVTADPVLTPVAATAAAASVPKLHRP